jgi:hypothetical protein
LEEGSGFHMTARYPFFGNHLSRFLAVGIFLSFAAFPLSAQKPMPRPISPGSNGPPIESQGGELSVAVRDTRGAPLDIGAIVHLYSVTGSYNVTTSTREVATAHFSSVQSGDYQLEVSCPGYRTATERLSLNGSQGNIPVYIFMIPESDPAPSGGNPGGVVMSPQLRNEIEKALQALQKQQFALAKNILTKATIKAPGNPDVVYFLGVAELGLQQIDLAREDFQKSLKLDPNHELALVSLGELQMKSGDSSAAIASFERAVATGRAGWRAHFQLASAYFKVNRLSDAESEASRAGAVGKNESARQHSCLEKFNTRK